MPNTTKAAQEASSTEKNYIYMSDIEYTDIKNYKSTSGWGNIEKDKSIWRKDQKGISGYFL